MLTFCGAIAPDESLDSEEDADMRRMSMSCVFLFDIVFNSNHFASTGHQPLFCAARQPEIGRAHV